MIDNPYKELGVRKVVNAAGVLTRIGGSRSPPEVFRAMEAASRNFVTIAELQSKTGEYLAEVTGAEAGLPTAGGSTSILLAAAACIMKGTELEEYEPKGPAVWRHIAQKLPLHTEGLRTEFIVQKCNRDEYDHAVECAGGRFKEVGNVDETTEKELRAAYDPEKTAAYYYTVKGFKGLPLDSVVKIAHKKGVPVVVDACGRTPTKEKPHEYVAMGVDLICFSGGKSIAGPNNSGILVGRRDLIKLAHLQSYPFEGVGRPAKMSRETIVGLVTALKIFLKRDTSHLFEEMVKKAERIVDELDKISGVNANVEYVLDRDKTPRSPLCTVKVDEEQYGMTTEELHIAMVDSDPSIVTIHEPYFLLENYHGLFTINPQFLAEGEDELIINEVKRLQG